MADDSIQGFKPKNLNFIACNETIFSLYDRNTAGSMIEYSRIISDTTIRVFMYAGDWDDIVPYTNTINNIERLGMRQNGPIVHWINTKTQQHIGFKRLYTQGIR